MDLSSLNLKFGYTYIRLGNIRNFYTLKISSTKETEFESSSIYSNEQKSSGGKWFLD